MELRDPLGRNDAVKQAIVDACCDDAHRAPSFRDACSSRRLRLRTARLLLVLLRGAFYLARGVLARCTLRADVVVYVGDLGRGNLDAVVVGDA